MAQPLGEILTETTLKLWLLDFTVKSGRPLREARKLAYAMLDKVCNDLLLLEYEQERKEKAGGEN